MSYEVEGQRELDRIAALVKRAADAASFAAIHVTQTMHTKDGAKLREAFEQMKAAGQAADDALRRLVALGANRPGTPVAADVVPLHLLDTPATRRLLSSLEAAVAAAAEVDRERGWVDDAGEPTGWGETLAALTLTLGREVYGPQGRE
jgi:hypothetical protein